MQDDEYIIYVNRGYRWADASEFCLIIAVLSAIFVMDNLLRIFVPIALVVLAIALYRKGVNTEDLSDPLYVIDRKGIRLCKKPITAPSFISWEDFLEARAKRIYPGGASCVRLVFRNAKDKREIIDLHPNETRLSSHEIARVINDFACRCCK